MKLLFIIILFFQSLFSFGEAGGIFLLIPPGAMAQGMGEAMVANTNTALMSYYNPASISFSDRNRISATHVNWLPNLSSDMYHQFVAFNYRLDERVSMGGHIIYLKGQFLYDRASESLDKEFMKAVAFSFAYKLSNASSIGFNIKTYEQKTHYIQSQNNAFDISYFKQGNKINFGILLSNIGSPIENKNSDYSAPAPTNLRLGILSQLYNDDVHTINLLFDANKLLVTRYQMMDWDGDGFVGGYDEFGNWESEGDPLAVYNKDGKKEYDNKGYFDDPWYLAIFTAWLDDWYLGGDIDFDGDRKIGGWTWDESMDIDSDDEPDIDELTQDESGVYGKCVNDEVCLEKGTGDNRSFSKELEEMTYNLGLEYWYNKTFSIRVGQIHDFEGKIFNPSWGFGLRLKQFGFDFGYTAGEQGYPRANTMFFSIVYQLKS